MAKRAEEGARSGDFLHVSILVPAKHADEFAERVQTFFDTGGFDHAKWTLAGAYRAEGPKSLSPRVTDVPTDADHTAKELPEEAGPFTTFVNVWEMPEGDSDGNLGNVMKDLADTDEYVALDDMVTREVQNLVWRIPMAFAIPAPAAPKKGDHFLRITRRVARDELAHYTMQLSFAVPYFLQLGWTYLGCHQNVTGLLNTFFELWQLPPSKDPEKLAQATLAKMAAENPFFAAVEASTFRETREVMTGAGYFTAQGKRAKR